MPIIDVKTSIRVARKREACQEAGDDFIREHIACVSSDSTFQVFLNASITKYRSKMEDDIGYFNYTINPDGGISDFKQNFVTPHCNRVQRHFKETRERAALVQEVNKPPAHCYWQSNRTYVTASMVATPVLPINNYTIVSENLKATTLTIKNATVPKSVQGQRKVSRQKQPLPSSKPKQNFTVAPSTSTKNLSILLPYLLPQAMQPGSKVQPLHDPILSHQIVPAINISGNDTNTTGAFSDRPCIKECTSFTEAFHDLSKPDGCIFTVKPRTIVIGLSLILASSTLLAVGAFAKIVHRGTEAITNLPRGAIALLRRIGSNFPKLFGKKPKTKQGSKALPHMRLDGDMLAPRQLVHQGSETQRREVAAPTRPELRHAPSHATLTANLMECGGQHPISGGSSSSSDTSSIHGIVLQAPPQGSQQQILGQVSSAAAAPPLAATASAQSLVSVYTSPAAPALPTSSGVIIDVNPTPVASDQNTVATSSISGVVVPVAPTPAAPVAALPTEHPLPLSPISGSPNNLQQGALPWVIGYTTGAAGAILPQAHAVTLFPPAMPGVYVPQPELPQE